MSHVKKCELCGNEFVAKRANNKYCKEKCAKKSWNTRNIDSKRKYWHKWKSRNTEKYNKIKKEWSERNPDKLKLINDKAVKKYRDKNPQVSKLNLKRYRDSLCDYYIKILLRHRHGINSPTPEQIEQKRLTLKIKRKINEIQRQIKSH